MNDYFEIKNELTKVKRDAIAMIAGLTIEIATLTAALDVMCEREALRSASCPRDEVDWDMGDNCEDCNLVDEVTYDTEIACWKKWALEKAKE